MADNSYGIWIISFLLVGILGMAFLTTINDAISTTTTPTSVSGETLANYGENTVTNTPLHAVTSVYTALTSTAYTDYIVTLASNLINLNTTQADTLELVAPHAEAAGYWSFNVNNSTNTIDDANGLNNGTLNPGSGSIINETFNSTTYDTPVQLAHTDLVADSVLVTTVDGGTTYTETTNYTIDYSAGTITTLSTGDMAENTNYYIDYNYSDSLPIWTDAGQYGGAYDFDGVDDYIDINNQLGNNTIGTIVAWLKLDTNGTEFYWYNSLNAGVSEIKTLWRTSDNRFQFGLTTACSGVTCFSSPVDLPESGWHHVVARWDNSAGGYMEWYLDGVNITDTSYGGWAATDINLYSGASARIGAREDTAFAYWNGSIDEVRIYNRSLSAEEIKEQYDTYMNTSVYKADYTYEQSGYVEGTSSNLLWLIPTFLLLSLLVLFWRLADQGA